MAKVMPKSEPPQIDKFRDLARELECDEDEARFEERFKKVATAPSASKRANPPPEGG
jgi:hypothetical protein